MRESLVSRYEAGVIKLAGEIIADRYWCTNFKQQSCFVSHQEIDSDVFPVLF